MRSNFLQLMDQKRRQLGVFAVHFVQVGVDCFPGPGCDPAGSAPAGSATTTPLPFGHFPDDGCDSLKIGVDFNEATLPAIVCLIVGDELWVVDEVTLHNSTTEALGKALREKSPDGT